MEFNVQSLKQYSSFAGPELGRNKAAARLDAGLVNPQTFPQSGAGFMQDADIGAGQTATLGRTPAWHPPNAKKDQTTLYEEYLYGRETYAKGKSQKLWTDSLSGRMAIRTVSRGVFGALAFVWGGGVASRQMHGYSSRTYKYSLEGLRKKPLQAVAKTFDVAFSTPIHAGVKQFAKLRGYSAKEAQVIANRAVRFRQKSYFHSEPGYIPGRSLGAEIVAITFDFASASTADATARNLIQLADPNLQKPWRDEHGNFDFLRLLSNTASGAWRIFSKNQGEDWAAALPYVFQMKFQRQALSKVFPGFKLSSDMVTNGASYRVNKSGKIIGDFQKAGVIDFQFRFMGYNWYTLMFRETYDKIRDKLEDWKESGYKLEMPQWNHPIESTVEGMVDAARYGLKSAIKSGIYMLPSVPFFWVSRVPTKWKAPLIVENARFSDAPNALVMSEPTNYKKDIVRNAAYGGHPEIAARTNIDGKTIRQGGKYTNNTHYVDIGYIGTKKVKIPTMGGANPYKLEHQKTLFSKILNPVGWASYQVGSGVVNLGDKIAATGGFAARLLPQNARSREAFLRNFVDASIAYTPYMIAKENFALATEDRGRKSGAGKMDAAIYSAIDNLATFNIKGVSEATRRIQTLLFDPESLAVRAAPAATPASDTPAEQPSPTKAHAEKFEAEKTLRSFADKEQKGQRGSAKLASGPIAQRINTSKILVQPSLQPAADDAKDWRERVQHARESQAKETFLYPESRTLQ